jgi:tetratricopeptide (TPR) repeat protein
MKKVLILFIILSSIIINAQPNCNYYYEKDSECYKACMKLEQGNFPQGSWQSQAFHDELLKQCPQLAYSWWAKSIPYLKRGEFARWREYLDKAVEIEPKEYLGYRAGCLFDFMRDYDAVLADLDRLDSLTDNPYLGYNASGDFDLRVFRAIALRETGRMDEALSTFVQLIEDNIKHNRISRNDYFFYATSLLKNKDIYAAIRALDKAKELDANYAEIDYYLGVAYEMKNEIQKSKFFFQKALESYNAGNYRNHSYDIKLPDQIYRSDITAKLDR